MHGEERIDRGDYDWQSGIDTVKVHPFDVKANDKLLQAISVADCIIAGPGDLYTTILPVLIVPGVKEAIQKSKAKKLFVVNITNKPFETNGYMIFDHTKAIVKHLGFFPFSVVIANTNISKKLVHDDAYSYVEIGNGLQDSDVMLVKKDLVNSEFPFHHDYKKLAKVIVEQL